MSAGDDDMIPCCALGACCCPATGAGQPCRCEPSSEADRTAAPVLGQGD